MFDSKTYFKKVGAVNELILGSGTVYGRDTLLMKLKAIHNPGEVVVMGTLWEGVKDRSKSNGRNTHTIYFI